MSEPHRDLTEAVIFGLGWIYLILAVANGWWAAQALKARQHKRLPKLFGGQTVPAAGFWIVYAVMLFVIAVAHFTGYRNPDDFPFRLPLAFKNVFDLLTASPVTYFFATAGLFALMVLLRKWWIKPTVAWIILNVAVLFMALSLSDYDFREIVGKPDNVPIVSMLFIVGFFQWLYFRRAVENDERIAAGRPLFEEEDNDKVLVWPDLVYTELICMVVLTVILVAWGIVLQAPLEQPANSARTPNPSKAPWYFLGLQEMLVYYDPWLAGVVFPSLIIVGLMAIPYIDFNKKGNGYYTFEQRKFSIIVFQFGFLPLWIALIILGTFLRGPNWGFFGIYEEWDPHKLEVLNNVYLSDWLWDEVLGVGVPKAAEGAGGWGKAWAILKRESPGFILILAYLIVLPPLLAATWLRTFYQRMGFIRYMVFANLLLFMAALPIKMILRWAFNLKYIVKIPEWFFNI